MSKNFQLLLRAEQDVANAKEPKPVTSTQPPLWSSSQDRVLPHALIGVDERAREQVSTLVRQLFFMPGAARAVVLAAIEAGNGNSWMAVQCSRILASQVNGSVCLVDANLSNPSLHRYLAAENRRGFSDAMCQAGSLQDFVQGVPAVPNLWLMTAGLRCADRGVFDAERLRERIRELRTKFEYLLVDSAPLRPGGDALMLGQATDGIALVIAERETRKESARHSINELRKSNVQILGVVLNKRTYPIPTKIYDRL